MRVKCRATELNTGALASVRPYPQIWTVPTPIMRPAAASTLFSFP